MTWINFSIINTAYCCMHRAGLRGQWLHAPPHQCWETDEFCTVQTVTKFKYPKRKPISKYIHSRFLNSYFVICIAVVWMKVKNKHDSISLKHDHFIPFMFPTDVRLKNIAFTGQLISPLLWVIFSFVRFKFFVSCSWIFLLQSNDIHWNFDLVSENEWDVYPAIFMTVEYENM